MKQQVSNYSTPAIILLIAMHVAGFIGLQHPESRPFFEKLIVFNLLTTTLLVLFFHPDFNLKFILFCLLAFLGGFLVEVMGVHTGIVFGNYRYGEVLGFKWWDVPLLIGFNWLVLIYCTGIISTKFSIPTLGKAFLGALLMVLLDYFIEPVAIQHKFWFWDMNTVPLQNYVAWFLASFVLLLLFHSLSFAKKNKVAVWMYFIQLLFFMAHVLVYNSPVF